eukprot:NODE_746_length_4249_cov_0.268916.p2 type:complete len:266 gc:universal NODE_746_length_4249_cov_0.268916:1839-1042(-)
MYHLKVEQCPTSMLFSVTSIYSYVPFDLAQMNCKKIGTNQYFARGNILPRDLNEHQCPFLDNRFNFRLHGIETVAKVFKDPHIIDISELDQNDPSFANIAQKYCDLATEWFLNKWELKMLCVDMHIRHSQLQQTNSYFHVDRIQKDFIGALVTEEMRSKYSEVLEQPITINLWINIGKEEIKNHNLHFIKPGEGSPMNNDDQARKMRPDLGPFNSIEFTPVESGNAIIFDSSHFFHASVDKGVPFQRHSVELRFKVIGEQVSKDV